MTAYEIVDRSEIEPRLGGKPSQRKDITELLLAVPQDGRVLRKDYSSNQDLKRDCQVLRTRIISNKLNIIVIKRVLRLYLVQRNEESVK